MKFLFQPLSPFIIGQKFGESWACIEPKTRKVIARTGKTCPVGYEDLYKNVGLKGHSGIDLGLTHGQPIYASQDGIVDEVCTELERGYGISVHTISKYPCIETGKDEYFKYRNWHLMAINKKLGDKVEVGDLLGWGDNTGLSSGDHLHFEVKPVTVSKKGTTTNILQNNGFYGAVNPEPYMEDMFALKMRDLNSSLKVIKDGVAKLAESFARFLRK